MTQKRKASSTQNQKKVPKTESRQSQTLSTSSNSSIDVVSNRKSTLSKYDKKVVKEVGIKKLWVLKAEQQQPPK